MWDDRDLHQSKNEAKDITVKYSIVEMMSNIMSLLLLMQNYNLTLFLH